MELTFKQAPSEENLRLFSRRFRALTGEGPTPLSTYQMKSDNVVRFALTLSAGGKIMKKAPAVKKVMGMVVSIAPYRTEGKGHAVGLFKFGDTLFYFNAWGDSLQGARRNMYLRKDKFVVDHFRKAYGSKRVIEYSGPSLQKGNKLGLCTGFTYNFMAEMCLLVHKGAAHIEKMVDQKKFDEYIHDKLTTRGLCYGGKCIPSRVDAFKEEMSRQLMKRQIDATPRVIQLVGQYNYMLNGRKEAIFGKAFAKELVGLGPEEIKKKILNKKRTNALALRSPNANIKRPSPLKTKAKAKGMTVAQLKIELKRRGLPLFGAKKNLQNRLNANVKVPSPPPPKAKAKGTTVAQLKIELKKRGLSLAGAKKNLQNRLNASEDDVRL